MGGGFGQGAFYQKAPPGEAVLPGRPGGGLGRAPLDRGLKGNFHEEPARTRHPIYPGTQPACRWGVQRPLLSRPLKCGIFRLLTDLPRDFYFFFPLSIRPPPLFISSKTTKPHSRPFHATEMSCVSAQHTFQLLIFFEELCDFMLLVLQRDKFSVERAHGRIKRFLDANDMLWGNLVRAVWRQREVRQGAN